MLPLLGFMTAQSCMRFMHDAFALRISLRASPISRQTVMNNVGDSLLLCVGQSKRVGLHMRSDQDDGVCPRYILLLYRHFSRLTCS